MTKQPEHECGADCEAYYNDRLQDQIEKLEQSRVGRADSMSSFQGLKERTEQLALRVSTDHPGDEDIQGLTAVTMEILKGATYQLLHIAELEDYILEMLSEVHTSATQAKTGPLSSQE